MTLSLLRRFGRNRSGNVAVMFSLVAVVLVGLIGFAVDFGQATRVRSQLQNATDVAALSVARDGLSVPDSSLKPIAQKYLAANYDATKTFKIDSLKFDRPTVTAELSTSATVSTTFLKVLGMSSIPVKAYSQTKGLGVEIALVLDTSGSMDETAGSGGKKITALKDATKSLFDILYGTTTTSQRFNIGIVPFAASVNVGSGYASAAWIDKAKTPGNADHDEDFVDKAINRFDLFSGTKGMKNVAWKGCVMTRHTPYDIDDTAPGTGYTLFVPWFAPDEPDAGTTGNGENVGYVNGVYKNYRTGDFTNDYLNDEGGGCTTTADTNKMVTDSVKQGRVCKYKGVTLTSSILSSGLGPNYRCDSAPITPLTNARATLDTAVASMVAAGNTNIMEGFMWGWRILSPTEPFTQGKAYTAPNNRKVIILMTDGQNNYGGDDNFNKSQFFAYGYSSWGHAGAATSNNNTLTTYLDAKTASACTKAKAKGITVYSIAFGADAAASQTLLRNCATDPSYYFAPQNSSDLKPTFQKIAESINSLRIAE